MPGVHATEQMLYRPALGVGTGCLQRVLCSLVAEASCSELGVKLVHLLLKGGALVGRAFMLLGNIQLALLLHLQDVEVRVNNATKNKQP